MPDQTDSPHEHPRPGSPEAERLDDELAVLGLGEPVADDVRWHALTCQECQHTLDAYRHIASLMRESGRPSARPGAADDRPALLVPPPSVWSGIAADLGVSGTSGPVDPGSLLRSRGARPPGRLPAKKRFTQRTLLAAAAVLLLVLGGAGVGGYLLGRAGSGQSQSVSLHASLAAQTGAANGATGSATIAPAGRGYVLEITTDALPIRTGYYEVWLFNPTSNQMIAVGALGVGHAGQFTVPAGIDLSAYPVVDISAQNFDGNNQHEQSMLRGTLAAR